MGTRNKGTQRDLNEERWREKREVTGIQESIPKNRTSQGNQNTTSKNPDRRRIDKPFRLLIEREACKDHEKRVGDLVGGYHHEGISRSQGEVLEVYFEHETDDDGHSHRPWDCSDEISIEQKARSGLDASRKGANTNVKEGKGMCWVARQISACVGERKDCHSKKREERINLPSSWFVRRRPPWPKRTCMQAHWVAFLVSRRSLE